MKIAEIHTGIRKNPKANGDSDHYIDRLRKRIFDLECSELEDRDLRIRIIEDVLTQLESGEINDAQAKAQLSLASVGFDDSPKPTIAAALSEDEHGNIWDAPEALPGLPPVPEWTPDLAAEALAPWLVDIAERIQCPADFPPVPAYTSAGSLIGTKCGIRPGRRNDWVAVPNLWGMCIGRPSAMKTPPSAEVLKHIRYLEIEARSDYEAREFERTTATIQRKALENAIKGEAERGAKNKKAPDLSAFREDFANLEDELREAKARRRFIVNDTTTERLGEILADNPHGLMLYRDELKGWLQSLNKAGREGDRAFYLECWNGTGSFVYDRIERGETAIPSACLSIFGTIQPGPLQGLIRASVEGSADDDGMIQRFQLMVYPDRLGTWRNVDAFPDNDAKQTARAVYDRLASATPKDFGANLEADIPYLRFDDDAQERWDGWREAFENRLLQADEHPAFEAHLTKYRSLVPSLALVNHLIDVGSGAVGLQALDRGIAYADHLEAHARRVYASVAMPDINGARALLGKLRHGQLTGDDGKPLNPFQTWRVYRRGWAGLSDRSTVQSAIQLLENFGWLQRRVDDHTGGRDRADIYLHPEIVAGWKQ